MLRLFNIVEHTHCSTVSNKYIVQQCSTMFNSVQHCSTNIVQQCSTNEHCRTYTLFGNVEHIHCKLNIQHKKLKGNK